ncbi:hypothetical protein B0G69_7103 [Paraburkholderia sp. RAU2J]|uniref:hypothetical protein n=1 Tax=Paraburkholderia sp. RAU2J TaxID=1938810 RepID=UPI000EAF02CD|nr:hypothetical protein [Paraburkholderia sp. RAU2J]RKT13892.1 hypothetical protein B0G69_7103 [Paraburkholderia sp. RAU2J]
MAHDDLAVLVGVGILALACLFVCGLYVYRSSDTCRNRKRRSEAHASGVQASGSNRESFWDEEAMMGTQLSHCCKSSLYRAVFGSGHDERIVFLIAGNRDDARKRATIALAAIHGVATHEVSLCKLASFRELIDIGVSEDEDLRVFEMAWKGENVSAWAEHPLFLTDDSSLLGKWAELYADLARELATSAIDRARG